MRGDGTESPQAGPAWWWWGFVGVMLFAAVVRLAYLSELRATRWWEQLLYCGSTDYLTQLRAAARTP